jgi:hypothetical protein
MGLEKNGNESKRKEGDGGSMSVAADKKWC